MTFRPAPVSPGAAQAPAIAGRLEPDAIGVTQDTVIGLASSAPAATVGLTLAATAAYGGGPVILLCALPMLVIANAYRRLNLWNANCGASFEWVGRAINPYPGFLTGWLMIAAYITGAVTGVVVLAPSVLAVAGADATSTAANIAISTAILVVMLVIAVLGIKLTARTQVAMAIAEYTILAGFAVAGLVWVLGHHPGTVPVTKGWFSLSGINGKGDLAAGLVASVYIFSGWDGTFYVNEEVRQRRVNPGRAAVFAVGILTVLYVLSQVGLQGVVSPARLQANSTSALVYVVGAMGGGAAAKLMALSLALSVVAATGTSIVLPARIVYGMAGRRVLPPFLGNVSGRFATPRGRQPRDRRGDHRPDDRVPAGRLAAERVQRRGEPVRADVRRVLHPDRAGCCHLLPAPYPQQRLGRPPGRYPPARRRGVPGLDLVPVPADCASAAAVVLRRRDRRRPGHDGYRAVRAAVLVLPDPQRKRLQGALMHSASVPAVPADQQEVVVCRLCQVPDPAPDSPCLPGHDHFVGQRAGCPACGRLRAECRGRWPCSVRRGRSAPLRLMGLRLRLIWRQMRPRPGPSCCGTPGRCSR